MPIHNSTVYNKRAMMAFILFQAFKTRRIRLVIAVVLGVVGLSVCSYGVWMSGANSGYTALGAVLLCLLVLLAFRWFIGPYLAYGKTVRSWTVTLNYEFYSRDFVARSPRVDAKRDSGLRYSALESVHERKNYIYLYANPTNAFIVDKSAFGAGELDKFKSLLRHEVDDNRLHLKK
ncbi:MAG: YcxB family protein [Clostridia bacterium]|nr:YcxB family protein [Clostridia bacterium]